jgi:hypothetical protein
MNAKERLAEMADKWAAELVMSTIQGNRPTNPKEFADRVESACLLAPELKQIGWWGSTEPTVKPRFWANKPETGNFIPVYIDADEPDPDLASRIDAELSKKRTLDLSEDAATLGEWIEDIECDNTEVLVKLSTIRAQLPDIEVKT